MELTNANCIFYPTLSIRLPELREMFVKLNTDANCYSRKKRTLLKDVGKSENET
jgi:hypothetical protein